MANQSPSSANSHLGLPNSSGEFRSLGSGNDSQIRPRSISAQQSSLLTALSGLGLDWHVIPTDSPNFIYPLLSIGGLDVKAEKTLFVICFPRQYGEVEKGEPFIRTDEDFNKMRIELIEKEVVVKCISMDEVCEVAPGESPNQIKIVYMYDMNKGRSKTLSTSLKKPYRLTITFQSLRDSTDVFYLIQRVLRSQWLGLKYGQICLHKSSLDKKASNGLTWDKRFIRLIQQRLIVYRTSSSSIPVNVFSLTGEVSGSHAVVEKIKKDQFSIDLSGLESKETRARRAGDRTTLLFRASSEAECDKWIAALKCEQDEKSAQPLERLAVPYFPSPSNSHSSPILPANSSTNHASANNSNNNSNKRPALAVTPSLRSIEENRSPAHSSPPPVHAINVLTSTPSASPSLAPTPTSASPLPSPALKSNIVPSPRNLPPTSPSKLNNPNFNSLGAAISPVNQSPSELRAEIDNLSHTLSSPTQFFNSLTSIRSAHIIHVTYLPSLSTWSSATPQGLMRVRGPLMKNIDSALETSHSIFQSTLATIKSARLLCVEEDLHGPSQIGFAFPGFDSAVFDVGRCSVLTASHLFEGMTPLSFQQHVWQSTLNAASKWAAKELMQASPDVTRLYDEGKGDEAKSIMHEAQLNVLENICVAAYLKSHVLGSSKEKLRSGDIVPFSSIISVNESLSQSNNSNNSNKNQKHLEAWANIAYLYDPDHLQQMMLFKFHYDQLKDGNLNVGNTFNYNMNNKDNSTANNSNYNSINNERSVNSSTDRDRAASPKLSPIQSPSTSPPTMTRSLNAFKLAEEEELPTNNSTVRQKHANINDEATAAVAAGVSSLPNSNNPSSSPQSSNNSNSSNYPFPPTVPSLSQLASTSIDSPSTTAWRALCSPVSLLSLIRSCIDLRLSRLMQLSMSLQQWLDKYTDKQSSAATGRLDAVSGLREKMMTEKKELELFMAKLPSRSAMETYVRQMEREDNARALANFLHHRPLATDLVKNHILNDSSVSSSSNENNMGKRKSIIAAHFQRRASASMGSIINVNIHTTNSVPPPPPPPLPNSNSLSLVRSPSPPPLPPHLQYSPASVVPPPLPTNMHLSIMTSSYSASSNNNNSIFNSSPSISGLSAPPPTLVGTGTGNALTLNTPPLPPPLPISSPVSPSSSNRKTGPPPLPLSTSSPSNSQNSSNYED